MPFINVKLAGTPPSAEQKAALIRELTEVLARVLGKNPATTMVIIEEVSTDNCGIGGESAAARSRKK